MIKRSKASIFDFAETVDALVNPVNCMGVAGKGLALEFKRRYPANHDAYRRHCSAGKLKIGLLFIVGKPYVPVTIINFPTKDDWRMPSRMTYITAGLQRLTQAVQQLDLKRIAIPALGCGNGGLEWFSVMRAVIIAFEALPDVEVMLCEPQ